MDNEKPTIRIIHNMARSGGTLIGKCIGCMQGIVLLSEIHPAGTKMFNPINQAYEWFRLLTDADIESIKRKGAVNFSDAIALIENRALEKNRKLIIRDWSHIDFTAVPFLARPSFRLTLAEVLKERFTVINTATVRHPIDQWISLRKLALMKDKLTLDFFLKGYLRFAEHSIRIGFLRYEDFVKSPESELKIICERLDIPYDPEFINRWSRYTKITGEVKSRRAGNQIAPLPRQEFEIGLLEAFEKNDDYKRSLDLLAYKHPE